MIRFLDWLLPPATEARLRARLSLYRHHLAEGGDAYMLRYILKHPWGTVRLHRITRSDRDRHLHDHPWDFTSILLTGGYVEELPIVGPVCGRPNCCTEHRMRPRWSVVRHQAEDLHRIATGRPVWTLVFTGQQRRKWGFQTEAGWMYWRDYLGVPEVDVVGRGADRRRQP